MSQVGLCVDGVSWSTSWVSIGAPVSRTDRSSDAPAFVRASDVPPPPHKHTLHERLSLACVQTNPRTPSQLEFLFFVPTIVHIHQLNYDFFMSEQVRNNAAE